MKLTKEQTIKSKIEKLEEELEKVKSNKTWKCPDCDKRTKISSLTVYQPSYWNDDPYALGCYPSKCGDYYIKCPKCEEVSRFMSDTTYNYKNPNKPILNKDKCKDWVFIDENIDSFEEIITLEDSNLTKLLYGD